MAWLKKDSRLRGHPKLIACADALDLKPVYLEGHLDSFWLACLERHEDGDLSKLSNMEIAILAEYNTKHADRFIQLLQEHRWLDDHLIHDWLDYVGDYLKRKYRKSPDKLLAIYKKHGREAELKKKDTSGTRTGHVPDTLGTSQEVEVDKEKETTPTTARADFESAFSPSCQLVLDAYRDVSGIISRDANTKNGARILAFAIDHDGLDAELVPEIIRRGLADTKLPNQGLQGIANGYHRYLPPLKPAATADDRVVVRYVCQGCGDTISLIMSRESTRYGHLPRPCDQCDGTMSPEPEG